MMVPSGIATASATIDDTSVPESSTMMPKCASSNSGVHCVSVRKSISRTCWKNAHDSETRMTTMPIVVTTDENAARNSSASTPRSFRLRENLKLRRPGTAKLRCAAPLMLSIPTEVTGCSFPLTDYSFASRRSNSSMLMPTSATPPKTVPNLPFSTCSQLTL